MYCEGSGKILKLENNSLHESLLLTTHHDSNNLCLQTENLYAPWEVPPEHQSMGHYRVEVGIVNHFQSVYCYIQFD
jgi:hypothetical protein